MEKSDTAELMKIVSSMNDEVLRTTFEAIKIEMQDRKIPLIVPTKEQIQTVKESIQEESKALNKINHFYAYETLGVNTYEDYLHLVNVNQSKLLKTKGKNKYQPRPEYEGLITVSRAKDRAMTNTVKDYNIFISPKNLITLKIEGMVNGGIVSKATLMESGLIPDSSFSLSIHTEQVGEKPNSMRQVSCSLNSSVDRMNPEPCHIPVKGVV